MEHETLAAEFDEQMLRIYQRALSELNYNASRFLQMLDEHRGLRTAILRRFPTLPTMRCDHLDPSTDSL